MNIVVWPERPEWTQTIRAAAAGATVVTPSNEAAALAAAPSADGWIGQLTPALLAAAPKLRWLQSPTLALEDVIFEELAASDLVVTKMWHTSDAEVANHALGLFLALCIELPRRFRDQLAGKWHRDTNWREIAEMTVLIVGFGAIGVELARRMAPLGAKIVAVDPRKMEPPAGVSEVLSSERLFDALPEAHAVIVCAPLTPQTKGLFDERAFKRMRDDALFLNLGRGGIVRTPALQQALTEGWIAAAAIDVVDPDPLPPEHPLWQLKNIIITPHVANFGSRSSLRALANVEENVRNFVAGKPLEGVADKSLWY